MNHSEQQNLRLIACPHVFSVEHGRIDALRPAGGTVRDLLQSIAWTRDHESVRVYVDGVLVHQAQWEHVVPLAGESVVVRAVPMGGQGGGGKDVGRLVAMIAVISLALAAPYLIGSVGLAAALFVTTPGVYGAIVAATSIVGTLAINGLIPAPLPRRGALPLSARKLKEAA